MTSVRVEFAVDRFVAGLLPKVGRALFAAANEGADRTRDKFGAAGRFVSSAPGTPPNWQTGVLAGSIRAVGPEATGNPLLARFGSAEPRAAWTQYGSTPRAGSTKYLPVPVNFEARRMLYNMKGASLRTRTDLEYRPPKDGKPPLLVQVADKPSTDKPSTDKPSTDKTPKDKTPNDKTRKDKKGGAVFVLKKSVRIPARPWAEPTPAARESMAAKFRAVMADSLRGP